MNFKVGHLFLRRNAPAKPGPSFSNFRHRDGSNKLKLQHGILKGLKDVLTKLVDHEEIARVIPGEIKTIKGMGQGKAVDIRVTLPLQPPSEGWKAIALAAGSRQEVFVTTKMSKQALEAALSQCGGLVTLLGKGKSTEEEGQRDNSDFSVLEDVQWRPKDGYRRGGNRK